jgi:ribosomal protein S27E
MTTHKLDLLQNAIDSLVEALAKYEQGEQGDARAYKFCVLHMSHFIELVFKHHITSKHPLLIYSKPFTESLDRNKAQTITLWEAINFINNEDAGAVSKSFRNDLDWVKQLRNQIEHYKFEMDIAETRTVLGRLFRSMLEFLDYETDLDVASHIPPAVMETFTVLSDEYSQRLNDAIKEAKRIADENEDPHDPDQRPILLSCHECGNKTLVINSDSSTGYRCTFCGNEEGENVPSYCDVCGAEGYGDEMTSWVDDEHGMNETRCYYCSGRYFADKDDCQSDLLTPSRSTSSSS